MLIGTVTDRSNLVREIEENVRKSRNILENSLAFLVVWVWNHYSTNANNRTTSRRYLGCHPRCDGDGRWVLVSGEEYCGR